VNSAFVDSWTPAQYGYAADVAVAALLSLGGVLSVTRGRIFSGAAIAQSSMLGIAVAVSPAAASWLAWTTPGAARTALACLFSVAASLLLCADARRQRPAQESLAACMFVAGAAGSVLLVASDPRRSADIERIFAGVGLHAGPLDVGLLVAACLLAAAVAVARRDELLLLASDPHMARAAGLPVSRWETGLAIWLGVIVALALPVSGLVFTFACLVVPALAARSLCRELRQVVAVAPAIAVSTSLVGLWLAGRHDLPPGPAVVALLCLIAGLAAATRRLRTGG
jgi:ABC-type Mn2+/Zn2+ transport system permease subunit